MENEMERVENLLESELLDKITSDIGLNELSRPHQSPSEYTLLTTEIIDEELS